MFQTWHIVLIIPPTYDSKCDSYLVEGDGHVCGLEAAPGRGVQSRGKGSSLAWGRNQAPQASLTRPFDTLQDAGQGACTSPSSLWGTPPSSTSWRPCLQMTGL